MNDQILEYLGNADRANCRTMAMIYVVNIITSLAILIPGVIDNFRPDFLIEFNDIHIAMAMTYMTMNTIFLHQILRHRDEHRRSYLLPCYVVLLIIDMIVEQIIVINVPRAMSIGLRFFDRDNVYYLAIAIITIIVYLNRYFSLRRKYTMLGRM